MNFYEGGKLYPDENAAVYTVLSKAIIVDLAKYRPSAHLDDQQSLTFINAHVASLIEQATGGVK